MFTTSDKKFFELYNLDIDEFTIQGSKAEERRLLRNKGRKEKKKVCQNVSDSEADSMATPLADSDNDHSTNSIAVQASRSVSWRGSSSASRSMSRTISPVRNVNPSKSHSKTRSKSLTPNERALNKSLKRQLVQYPTSGSETSDESGPRMKKNKKESLLLD